MSITGISGSTGGGQLQSPTFGQALKQSWANTFAQSKALGVLRVAFNLTGVGALIDLAVSGIRHKMGVLGVNAQPTQSRGIGRQEDSRIDVSSSDSGSRQSVSLRTRFESSVKEGLGMIPPYDAEAYTSSALQDMVDDEGERELMKEKLKNPTFSSQNFVGFRESEKSGIFIAVFKNKEGGEEELEFSNRIGRFEIRGQRLKDLLSKSDYSNLSEMIERTQMTSADAMLGYVCGAAFNTLINDCKGKDKEEVRELVESIRNQTIPGTKATYGEMMELDDLLG
ncbi:hypothetical protein DB346_05980 [Verrucomicrobia bacterium LW23]|nr:hypothetical protein DB346_05980 [Verrucomicrobia bacterium LW23]